MSQPVVAAICYRRNKGRIEFLLVRTSGGRYWTFPKGHVEKKPPERPWAAARREAIEEAGVTGKIKKKPLTSYKYFKDRHGDKRIDIIDAYLLPVNAEVKPQERTRDPRWFTAEIAIKKLAAGGREKRYAREHARVIKEAVAKLGGKNKRQQSAKTVSR
jgi:8-oxo-dGTP pyrophosphatase MutT (NUDIX family)